MSEDNNENADNEEDVAEPVFPQSGPGREEMVGDYLPGSEEWQAKTNLDVNDPAAVAALRSFGQIYPEVDELQELIDDFLDDFMQTKTSVAGMSREEYRKIMMAMYGSSDGDEGSNVALRMVGADDE